jgi:hypothetical protein
VSILETVGPGNLIKVAVTIKKISIIKTTSNIGVKSIVWPCVCAFAVLFLMVYQ